MEQPMSKPFEQLSESWSLFKNSISFCVEHESWWDPTMSAAFGNHAYEIVNDPKADGPGGLSLEVLWMLGMLCSLSMP